MNLKYIHIVSVFALLMLVHLVNYAQINEDQIIENTIAQTDNQFENENIVEDLRFLIRNPLPINDTTTNYNLLIQYGLITPLQVDAVKDYINKHGFLITKKELTAIPKLNESTVKLLLPFITVSQTNQNKLSLLQQIKSGYSRIVLRNQFLEEEQRGFKSVNAEAPKFLGDKHHTYFKIQHRYKQTLSIGLLGDKDAGEEFFTGTNAKGFDFYSAHIRYKPEKSWINQVNIGDYEVKLGQGLIQWNGFRLGKGTDATTVFLKAPVLREYTSSNELNYLRGLAADFQLTPSISMINWFSRKAIDANQLFNDDDEFLHKISSIQTSGFHRTKFEIEDEKSTTETIAGTALQYENSWLKLGIAGQHRHLSDSLIYRNQSYQKHFPRGNDFTHLGVNYTILKKRNYIFGETAYTNQALSTVNGIQHFFRNGIKGTVFYRNYGKAYKSQYAAAIGENTSPHNEQGIYAGIEFSPFQSVKTQAYLDVFSFPFEKFRVSEPSNGQELLIQTIYKHPKHELEVELRNKLEHKEINETGSKNLTQQKRYVSRIEMRYHINENIYLKSRIGHTFFEKSNQPEHGWLGFQDIIYEPFPQQLKLYTRFAKFYAPSYNSRNYAYENDLLYNFSVPAYYGQGNRYYVMCSYSPHQSIKIWLKAAQSHFLDRTTISSGNTKIEGNQRTEYKMQIQVKF